MRVGLYGEREELEREYEAKDKEQVNKLGFENQFALTKALNDDEKWQGYAHTDLFVIPTYSENFGNVVVEAFWTGAPVITTKGTPWQELEIHKCGWWIDIGVKPLVDVLKEVMELSDFERREMGECGWKLVEGKYTWNTVVKKLEDGIKKF